MSSSVATSSLPSWWPHSYTQPAYNVPYIRPLGAAALEGLTSTHQGLLALDHSWGYIFEIDPVTAHHQVLNPLLAFELRDTSALASSPSAGRSTDVDLWLARDRSVFRIPLSQLATAHSLDPYQVCTAPDPIESLAPIETDLLVSCHQRSKLWRLDPVTGTVLAEFRSPGVGQEHIVVRDEVIWVSDRVEETIYVLDLETGEELARFLTPYPAPTGLTFWHDQLWVAYATEESYIHDSPNDPDPLSVAIRNKTLLAPLRIRSPQPLPSHPDDKISDLDPVNDPSALNCPIVYLPQMIKRRAGYTLTSGYQVELTYLEEFDQEDPQTFHDLIWKIALPCHSRRQVVHSVTAIGHPFHLEQLQGQQIAVYNLGSVKSHEARIFGWKAILDLYSIKFQIDPRDVEMLAIPDDLATRYLVDDDYLSMNMPIVQEAARAAIGTETNVLRKMAKIREFVYDQLAYRVTPRIEPPDVVLQQGFGSCGEYVGLLLALARLNGIACRTVGRYKCPPFPELKQVPLLPQYNHVWIEFYLPGWGWVPMESNTDDLGDPPYPERYFMGLPWTHAEIAKGIPFETCNIPSASIGQLAVNHVQFRILKEL